MTPPHDPATLPQTELDAPTALPAGYTTRELPHEEWGRVDGFGPFETLPLPDPETSRLVVIEHNGQIIGCWAALNAVHCEGLFIDPAYRHKPAVARALLAGMLDLLHACEVTAAFTFTVDPLVRRLADRHGFPTLRDDTGTPVVAHVWTAED